MENRKVCLDVYKKIAYIKGIKDSKGKSMKDSTAIIECIVFAPFILLWELLAKAVKNKDFIELALL